MMTEKQIKAKFNKAHLAKLVREMLKIKFREDKPLYTLRPGYTPENIAERVAFDYIQTPSLAKPRELVKLYATRNAYGRRDRCEVLRLTAIVEDGKIGYEIPGYKREYYKNDAEYVDKNIETSILDCDYFMNNNSAIDIYI